MIFISICVISILLAITYTIQNKKVKIMKDYFLNNQHLYGLSLKWIEAFQRKSKISDWFEEHEVKRVLIYGAGNLGKILMYELKSAGIEVVGFIDKKDVFYFYGVQGFYIFDNMPDADMIVVTPIHYYDAIRDELAKYTEKSVVSLENIINDMK